MSGWDLSSSRVQAEEAERREWLKCKLSYHVPFLDDYTNGILRNDLVVLGAPTGTGKTALAAMIALENSRAGKRVHYLALEAEPNEIERRMKHRLWAAHTTEPKPYADWFHGDAVLPEHLERQLVSDLAMMQTFYRGARFNRDRLLAEIEKLKDETDLIILDHLHYVDIDDRDEYRGMKDVVMSLRDKAMELGAPLLLIAHLRKRDRGSPRLVPDIDDFHGTSDITKIATRVIVLSPGPYQSGARERVTYFAVHKDRWRGKGWEVALIPFDLHTGTYAPRYRLGRLVNGDTEWQELEDRPPSWARRAVSVR